MNICVYKTILTDNKQRNRIHNNVKTLKGVFVLHLGMGFAFEHMHTIVAFDGDDDGCRTTE